MPRKVEKAPQKQLFAREARTPRTEVHHWNPHTHAASCREAAPNSWLLTYLVPLDGTIFDIMVWLDSEKPLEVSLTIQRGFVDKTSRDHVLLPGPRPLGQELEVKRGDRLLLIQKNIEQKFTWLDLAFKLRLEKEPLREVEEPQALLPRLEDKEGKQEHA